jgi:hypothetical protein
MAGLDPAIHVFVAAPRTWMPGTSPGMTASEWDARAPQSLLNTIDAIQPVISAITAVTRP